MSRTESYFGFKYRYPEEWVNLVDNVILTFFIFPFETRFLVKSLILEGDGV